MSGTTALPPRRLLTVREAAPFLRCSEKTLRRYVERREIPSYKIGGKRLFDPADLAAYIAAGREEAVDSWDF
jgi:excisionase family DNA binding protein